MIPWHNACFVFRELVKRIDRLYDAMEPMIPPPDIKGYPCALKYRQGYMRAKDQMDEVRAITRDSRFPRVLNEADADLDCPYGVRETGERISSAVFLLQSYENDKRKCRSTWHPSEGLEGRPGRKRGARRR